MGWLTHPPNKGTVGIIASPTAQPATSVPNDLQHHAEARRHKTHNSTQDQSTAPQTPEAKQRRQENWTGTHGRAAHSRSAASAKSHRPPGTCEALTVSHYQRISVIYQVGNSFFSANYSWGERTPSVTVPPRPVDDEHRGNGTPAMAAAQSSITSDSRAPQQVPRVNLGWA